MQKERHVGKFMESDIDISGRSRHPSANRKMLPGDPRANNLFLQAASDLPRHKPRPCPERRVAREGMNRKEATKVKKCSHAGWAHTRSNEIAMRFYLALLAGRESLRFGVMNKSDRMRCGTRGRPLGALGPALSTRMTEYARRHSKA